MELNLEGFDLEDHVGGDGAFFSEEGIGQSGFGDGADFPGDAEGDLVNGPEGLLVQEGFPGAGQLQVVSHIVFGFFGLETGRW